MKAQVRTDSLGDVTIHLEGGLDHENCAHLRSELESITAGSPGSKVTLDLDKMDFVGSSGIDIFVDVLKVIDRERGRVRLVNVKPEFLKVFRLYGYDLAGSPEPARPARRGLLRTEGAGPR